MQDAYGIVMYCRFPRLNDGLKEATACVEELPTTLCSVNEINQYLFTFQV